MYFFVLSFNPTAVAVLVPKRAHQPPAGSGWEYGLCVAYINRQGNALGEPRQKIQVHSLVVEGFNANC
jgi:hypothetical protein